MNSDFYNYVGVPVDDREWLEELRLQIVEALLYQIQCVRKHGHCPELSDTLIREGSAVLHLYSDDAGEDFVSSLMSD